MRAIWTDLKTLSFFFRIRKRRLEKRKHSVFLSVQMPHLRIMKYCICMWLDGKSKYIFVTAKQNLQLINTRFVLPLVLDDFGWLLQSLTILRVESDTYSFSEEFHLLSHLILRERLSFIFDYARNGGDQSALLHQLWLIVHFYYGVAFVLIYSYNVKDV